MTSRGINISVLYGRRAVDGFYSRFGYYGIGRYVDLEIIAISNFDKRINIIPFKREYLKTCIKLYKKTYSNLSGSILRNPPIWEFLLTRLKKGTGGFKMFLCFENQESIGYFVELDKKLVEICLPSQFFPFMPAILRSLDISSISIHQRHPFYIYCRTQMNTILKERFAIDGGYMAKILNPGFLLEKLGQTFISRASVIGVSNKSISLLGYEVDLGSGKLSKTDKNDISFEKVGTAVLLLLGIISCKDIVGMKWTNKKPWIPYLFPELYFHTSVWDEV
jgi:hypothetical protein